ncbi:MAG: hypothetical protein HFG35_13930 [Eubacterium sp.]|nr:hypothetical protein [Eubacterium sp.]
MVEVYNYFIGGYIPKVSPKTNVHDRKELKNKYKSIVSLNNANPLAMIRLSPDTQIYALDVKEISMEMGEAAQNTLDGKPEEAEEHADKTLKLFNKLLVRSDEYGDLKNKPSRPGCELRNLVAANKEDLEASGFTVEEDGFLSINKEKEFQVPVKFMEELKDKCEYMSMNPMEYVEKKVFSYAHLHRSDVGYAYASSVYTGMLFNSYC